MARKIILKEDGLDGSVNAPSGYKFIGDSDGSISEKIGATISSIGGSVKYLEVEYTASQVRALTTNQIFIPRTYNGKYRNIKEIHLIGRGDVDHTHAGTPNFEIYTPTGGVITVPATMLQFGGNNPQVVANPKFATAVNGDWTFNTGIFQQSLTPGFSSISVPSPYEIPVGGSYVTSSSTLTIGETYSYSINIANYNSGDWVIRTGTTVHATHSSGAVHTGTFVATDSVFNFGALEGSARATIYEVKVTKEIGYPSLYIVKEVFNDTSYDGTDEWKIRVVGGAFTGSGTRTLLVKVWYTLESFISI